MRYLIRNIDVISVEERFETLKGYRTEKGEAVIEQRSIGWYVRISQSSAIFVGTEEPPFKKGDKINLTLEKA